MHDDSGRPGLRAAGKLGALALAGAVLVGVLIFLLIGNVLNDTADDEIAAPGTGTDFAGEALAREAYRDVTLGIDKEALTERLLPAEPVDRQVLDRYQSRSPETAEASCLYYEAAGGDAEDLFRFCFRDDRLVDKTVVLPEPA